MGRIARLAAAGPRVGSAALSPGRAPPRPAAAGPRVGHTTRLAAAGSWMGRTARLVTAGPRVGFAALSPGGIHRSVPGWAIPLGPPGGPHRSAGRYRSPDGPHRPLVAAGPRLGYTARSPGWAVPPS